MSMILQSEDMALLMGSLSRFGLLALTMYFTRGIDWNSLGGRGKPDDATPSAQAPNAPAATAVATDAANPPSAA